MKNKKQLFENIVHGIFLILGLIAVACVLMITIYLVISGIPAIRKIGLVPFLFGTTWASTAAEPSYGILPFILTSVYGTAGAIVIGVPIGWFMTAITSLLTNLQGVGGAVFGAAIGIGMSTDQGGPISKAVALVANGLNADGILGPAACKMCGGMQNPLGVCFAQIIDRFAGKKKFTEKERSTTVSGLVLACCYIQEYVIPFLVQDTWRCIIPCMIGGAISGGLCGYFALESAAVHGGVFVIPMMSNPLQFVLFWFAGAAVNGILYFLLRKPVEAEGDMAGNGVLDQLLG